MTEYVCLNPRVPGKVLLRRREKEPFKTLFNLVGGKIKGKETTVDCCRRHFAELFPDSEPNGLRVMGYKTGPGYTVWYANVYVAGGREREGVWLDLNEAVQHQFVVPDLRIILPLLCSAAPSWKLTEQVGPKYTLEFLPCLT